VVVVLEESLSQNCLFQTVNRCFCEWTGGQK